MFFSVKSAMKINGKVYIPCVCYSVVKGLEMTVADLVAKGKAKQFEDIAYFQNGKELNTVAERKAEIKEKKKAERKAKKEAEFDIPTSLDEIAGF